MGQVGTNERAKVLSDGGVHLLKYMTISLAWWRRCCAVFRFGGELETSNALAPFLTLQFLASTLTFPRSSYCNHNRLVKDFTCDHRVITSTTIMHEQNSCMYTNETHHNIFEYNLFKDNYVTPTAVNSYPFRYLVEHRKKIYNFFFIAASIIIINGNRYHVRCILSKVRNGNYYRGEFTRSERMFQLKLNSTKTY